jgi:peroxiredoxin
MLQAEIAGRLVAPPEKTPANGALIRDFQLLSVEGKPVLFSEYRGRFNMVLVFVGQSKGANDFLSNLQKHRGELAENEARVLAVLAGSQQRCSELKRSLGLSFEVLADEDGRVHRLLGAVDTEGHICPAVFVTDRFGEVFSAYSARQGKGLPGFEEILSWIDFINRQCPECGAREWPE